MKIYEDQEHERELCFIDGNNVEVCFDYGRFDNEEPGCFVAMKIPTKEFMNKYIRTIDILPEIGEQPEIEDHVFDTDFMLKLVYDTGRHPGYNNEKTFIIVLRLVDKLHRDFYVVFYSTHNVEETAWDHVLTMKINGKYVITEHI